MPATKRQVRAPASGAGGRGAGVSRKARRSETAEIKAEIAALTKKIERELVELNARADRMLADLK